MPSVRVTWVRPSAITDDPGRRQRQQPAPQVVDDHARGARPGASRAAPAHGLGGARWWMSSEQWATSTAPSSSGRARTSASTTLDAGHAPRRRVRDGQHVGIDVDAATTATRVARRRSACRRLRFRRRGSERRSGPDQALDRARCSRSVPPGSRFRRARSARLASTSAGERRPESSSSAASARAAERQQPTHADGHLR